MKRFLHCLGLVLLRGVLASCQTTRTSWVCITATVPWTIQAAPPMSIFTAAAREVMIETRKPLQKVEGFGGCFNELGWQALLALPVTIGTDRSAGLIRVTLPGRSLSTLVIPAS